MNTYQERYDELVKKLQTNESNLGELSKIKVEKRSEYENAQENLDYLEKTKESKKILMRNMINTTLNKITLALFYGLMLTTGISIITLGSYFLGQILLITNMVIKSLLGIGLMLGGCVGAGAMFALFLKLEKIIKKYYKNKIINSEEYKKISSEVDDKENEIAVAKANVDRTKKELLLVSCNYDKLERTTTEQRIIKKWFEQELASIKEKRLTSGESQTKPYTRIKANTKGLPGNC